MKVEVMLHRVADLRGKGVDLALQGVERVQRATLARLVPVAQAEEELVARRKPAVLAARRKPAEPVVMVMGERVATERVEQVLAVMNPAQEGMEA